VATLFSRLVRLAHANPEMRGVLLPILASSDERVVLREEAMTAGTVQSFLSVLVSKLTQHDKKLSMKQPNDYRLSHYLGAAQKVEKAVKAVLQADDAKALGKLKDALEKNFIVSDMPPVKNVIKQIDVFMATGKKPTILASERVAARGDPAWMTAKFPGKAADGTPIKKGDKVLYWPLSKKMMVGKQAEQAWRDFESQAADEDGY